MSLRTNTTSSQQWNIAIILWLAAWAITFFEPLRAAMRVWIINDTFNHCFFILPASLYFIWQERGAIAARAPQKSSIGFALLAIIIGIFALGQAAYIDVLQHISAFEIIPILTLALFGWKVVRQIWFPLLFISFSIPLGEELFGAFQLITADIAIALLKLIGIPVYRDGLYISIPNGRFVVAEACSGIRFFIACAVMGTAISYVNFISRARALAFTLFAIVMPIIANGIRAFGIIYIGYKTNMEKAVGADHLIYGWIFFALVVVLLIIVAHIFSDGHRRWRNQPTLIAPEWQSYWNYRTLIAAIAPLLLVKALVIVQEQYPESPFTIDANEGLSQISKETAENYLWTPRIQNADIYRYGSDTANAVSTFEAIYRFNAPEHELISWQNRLFDINHWSLRETHQLTIDHIGTISVLDLTSTTSSHRLLAYWYVTPGYVSSSPYKTKLRQAINTLLLQPSGGALIAVNLPYITETDVALDALKQVLNKQAQKLSVGHK